MDSKLTFESHVRSLAASASRRIGILRKTRMCSGIILLYLVVFGRLFFLFLSIALQSGFLLPLVTCLCLIGSFEVYLGLVVVLFAVICDTDAELPLCLCSIAFVFLLVIRWGSYFLSCTRLVALPYIILLCTPSLLWVLDVAPRSTCVRLFLLVFRYAICLMSRTLLAIFGSLQDSCESYP